MTEKESVNLNEVIFETTDPLGNLIFLSKKTWEEKITNAVTGHVEMIGEEQLVKSTIEDPDAIYPDKEFGTTDIYLKCHNNLVLNSYGTHCKVAVDIELGRIKTAYITSKKREKGKPKYLKKNGK